MVRTSLNGSVLASFFTWGGVGLVCDQYNELLLVQTQIETQIEAEAASASDDEKLIRSAYQVYTYEQREKFSDLLLKLIGPKWDRNFETSFANLDLQKSIPATLKFESIQHFFCVYYNFLLQKLVGEGAQLSERLLKKSVVN